MFKEENIARLETIRDKIEKIFEICEKNKKISIALDDAVLARPAIIMHFISCEEQLNKISLSADLEALNIFSKEEILGFNTIRNIGAHDYDGIRLDVIEDVIRFNLPPLKEKIDSAISEYYANLDNQNKTEQSMESKNDSSALDELRAKHGENSETDTDTDSDKGDKNKPKGNKK